MHKQIDEAMWPAQTASKLASPARYTGFLSFLVVL